MILDESECSCHGQSESGVVGRGIAVVSVEGSECEGGVKGG